ncbi:hypothetical protein E2C01_025348 [Portunus trituberculatus]|uniref:Uncharacterized protein n=1 Tax=Portunus trituberculatus TaxID=210409 RepID=A0A5B7EF92_PORTR|nr:hypothetical protein [Portunus trituberculatus]
MDGSAVVDVATLDGPAALPAGGSSPSYYTGGSESPVLHGDAPGHEAHSADGVLAVGQQLRARGISEVGAEIILASWKPATARQYKPHIMW